MSTEYQCDITDRAGKILDYKDTRIYNRIMPIGNYIYHLL